MDNINWTMRLANEADVPLLQPLITDSVRILQAPFYSSAQRQAALGGVFGVDRQLIRDGTYFVVEHDGQLIGCGGWSKRETLCGSDAGRAGEDPLIDPAKDPARIRGFFVHPNFARRGIGRAIMRKCELAIIEAGFRSVEIVATLAGESLYAAFDYEVIERYQIPVPGNLNLPVVRMKKSLSSQLIASKLLR